MKRVFLTFLLVIFVAQIGFAANVTYRWKYSGDESIDFYEVRLNGGEWQKIPANKNSFSYKMTKEEANNLTDTSFEIRSVANDRRSDIVTIPSPVKEKKQKAVAEVKAPEKDSYQMADSVLQFKLTPYSKQYTLAKSSKDLITSDYGFGFELSEKERIVAGLYADAGLCLNFSMLKNVLGEDCLFTNLLISAGVGYEQHIFAGLYAFAHIDVVSDTMFFLGEVGEEFSVKAGLGFDYMFNDKLGVTASVDAMLGLEKNYNSLTLIPSAGISYAL